MIPVDVAMGMAVAPKEPEAPSVAELSDDDNIAVDYLDSRVESGIYGSFTGKTFEIRLAPTEVSPQVVAAVKSRYEAGGWIVGVFLHRNKDEILEYIQLAFTPSNAVISTPKEGALRPKVMPPLKKLTDLASTATSSGVRPSARVLVRMPTRGRPVQAIEVISAYREKAGMPVAIEVVIDEDDDLMRDTVVLQRLNALDCTITVGKHGSKIEAVNGGRVTEWDILVLASDDMVPVSYGYAIDIVGAMEDHFPHFDGAIYFDDGVCGDKLCTLPIFGKRLHEQFGYVYDPSYVSLCCDTEQTEILKAMGRLAYVDKCTIEHQHPVNDKYARRKDAQYDKNNAFEPADKATFDKRKATVRPYSQFGFDAPPLWLSIGIATTRVRRGRLERLLDHLYTQIKEFPREVEIIVDHDEHLNIGQKRQRLLDRSIGHFVAHIDDDDWVPSDYVKRVLGAIKSKENVDCVGLVGVLTTNGSSPEVFTHSLAHREWKTEGGVHYRSPNHLNPIRRSAAIAAGGFANMVAAEDHDYSKRVLPFLKEEASPGSEPLYFYWCSTTKRTLGG